MRERTSSALPIWVWAASSSDALTKSPFNAATSYVEQVRYGQRASCRSEVRIVIEGSNERCMLVPTEQVPEQLLCLPRRFDVVTGRDIKRVVFGPRLTTRHDAHGYQRWLRLIHSEQRRKVLGAVPVGSAKCEPVADNRQPRSGGPSTPHPLGLEAAPIGDRPPVVGSGPL